MSDDTGSESGERSAGFVITAKRDGAWTFLLLRHRGDGHWAFPKGRVEDGEDELEAATRETTEETGIGDIQPIPGFCVETSYRFRRDERQVSKRVTYFLAEAARGAVRLSDEHQESRWLGAEEAAELLTYEESRRVLECALRHLA
ncbi:NUDIX domain-containing protein, partial [Candidatus Bipolaricaulota bacterium]|nr:NUDIX domain-containing protein [Candidatus Bipolaricaulota bacterium]